VGDAIVRRRVVIKTKAVYENDSVIISTTGCDYDFVATIENKTSKDIILTLPQTDDFAGSDVEPWEYRIPANNWIGLFNYEYEGNLKFALEQGDFTTREVDASNA
jgi:hypothetical protein